MSPWSQSKQEERYCLHSDWAYWGCSDTDVEEEGGGGGGRVGGNPTPGGPTGGDVMAV